MCNPPVLFYSTFLKQWKEICENVTNNIKHIFILFSFSKHFNKHIIFTIAEI